MRFGRLILNEPDIGCTLRLLATTWSIRKQLKRLKFERLAETPNLSFGHDRVELFHGLVTVVLRLEADHSGEKRVCQRRDSNTERRKKRKSPKIATFYQTSAFSADTVHYYIHVYLHIFRSKRYIFRV